MLYTRKINRTFSKAVVIATYYSLLCQVPLPVTTYSLQELVHPINIFYRTSRPNPINQQQSTYQSLDTSKPISMWSYLEHYIKLVTSPIRLYKEVFPPYRSHGVLFFPDLYMDFKGDVHLLQSNCKDVLLLAHEMYGREVLVHYGKYKNVKFSKDLSSNLIQNSSLISSNANFLTPTIRANDNTLHEGELTIIMKPDSVIKMNTDEVSI